MTGIWSIWHMHSIIKPNQPVMEHLGFPSPSCQGSFKAENRENTSKPNKQHVGCWVGNHHDGYPGWFQERGKPQILLIMKLWIKPLVELRCPRRQTKNLWIQLVERLYLILILITCFRHSWVKGYTQSVTWSTACVRYSKGVPLRVVTSCPLLFTPRFQNRSSLLLGATLEHTKILWTLCPTKIMAFCRMGPSNRSSSKFRIFCSNSRTPLGGSGLCGNSNSRLGWQWTRDAVADLELCQ